MAIRGASALLIWLACLASLSPLSAGAEEGEPGHVELHGYGEVHYNNPQTGTMSSGAGNEIDSHRFVLGWEYEFTPRARVEAEVDFEHAATELELEEAYIEYDLAPAVSLRAGALLMPVGPLNESHKPTLYYSVERPYVQHYIIPTTWQENGLGVAGRADRRGLGYRAYVTAGLDAARITALGGLHDVSSKGAESKADDLAATGRIEWSPAPGLSLGGSGYFGGADQRAPGLGTVTLGLAAADARYRRAGFDLRGVFVRTSLDGAARVSALVGETVGKAMQGWSLEAAYDLLGRGAAEDAPRSLVGFIRHEDFDTVREAPPGLARDPAARRRVTTGGVAYYPIEKIAFKTDLEHWENDAGARLNRVNLGAAFTF